MWTGTWTAAAQCLDGVQCLPDFIRDAREEHCGIERCVEARRDDGLGVALFDHGFGDGIERPADVRERLSGVRLKRLVPFRAGAQRLEQRGEIAEEELEDFVQHEELEPASGLAVASCAGNRQRLPCVLQRFARAAPQRNQRFPLPGVRWRRRDLRRGRRKVPDRHPGGGDRRAYWVVGTEGPERDGEHDGEERAGNEQPGTDQADVQVRR